MTRSFDRRARTLPILALAAGSAACTPRFLRHCRPAHRCRPPPLWLRRRHPTGVRSQLGAAPPLRSQRHRRPPRRSTLPTTMPATLPTTSPATGPTYRAVYRPSHRTLHVAFRHWQPSTQPAASLSLPPGRRAKSPSISRMPPPIPSWIISLKRPATSYRKTVPSPARQY